MDDGSNNKKSWLIWIFFIILSLGFCFATLWPVAAICAVIALVTMPARLKSIRLEDCPRFQLVAEIIGVFAVIAVIAGAMSKGDEINSNLQTPKILSVDEVKVIVAVKCKQHIQDNLTSPKSADFPWTSNITFDGHTAQMSSYVDAQNGFGGQIRTHYNCILDFKGGEPDSEVNWQLRSLTVLK